jgi:hypothetical protein
VAAAIVPAACEDVASTLTRVGLETAENTARKAQGGSERNARPVDRLPRNPPPFVDKEAGGGFAHNPPGLLANDIRNNRNFTNTPNNALRDLINLNKSLHP